VLYHQVRLEPLGEGPLLARWRRLQREDMEDEQSLVNWARLQVRARHNGNAAGAHDRVARRFVSFVLFSFSIFIFTLLSLVLSRAATCFFDRRRRISFSAR
jgi:hypothetical protein